MQRAHSAASLSLASSSLFPMNLIGNTAPVRIGNVFQGIRKYCPEDYICIVDAVKSSAVTSGNIAFIVELLKNISSDWQTSGIHASVTWEKMKVLKKKNQSHWTQTQLFVNLQLLTVSDGLFWVKCSRTITTAADTSVQHSSWILDIWYRAMSIDRVYPSRSRYSTFIFRRELYIIAVVRNCVLKVKCVTLGWVFWFQFFETKFNVAQATFKLPV